MRPVLLIAIAMLGGCTDPFISIPGGKLDGEISPAPDSWPTLPEVVQLEVRPKDPYSLNIWAVNAGEHIYVATNEAKWVPFIDANAHVRLKSDGTLWALTAERVMGEAELAQVGEAYAAKYEWSGGDDSGPVNVFRLTPR